MLTALERVAQSEESADQESAVRGLRRSVVLTIAERELRNSDPVEKPASEDSAA